MWNENKNKMKQKEHIETTAFMRSELKRDAYS